ARKSTRRGFEGSRVRGSERDPILLEPSNPRTLEPFLKLDSAAVHRDGREPERTRHAAQTPNPPLLEELRPQGRAARRAPGRGARLRLGLDPRGLGLRAVSAAHRD